MAVLYGKNYGKPTLDLNFAGNKSLIDTTTRANYVTFSRAQSANEATYVGSDGLIKYASADEPRFDHDPETLESLGLLVEESRTNELTYSVITNANWGVVDGATITDNQATAPDGTNTAALINFPAVGVPRIFITTSIASGTRMVSCWIKAKTGTVTVRVGNGSDFGSNQVVGTEWTRIMEQVPSSSSSAGIYCSNPVSGAEFYAWGFQQEVGTFPTSYIPTSGSTETRAADEASITGTNFSRWYNQSEGTMFVDSSALGLNTLNRTAYITDGSTSNSLGIVETSSLTQFLAYTGGVLQANLSFAQTGLSKKAFAYAVNDAAFTADGNSALTDTSVTLPGLDRMDLISRIGADPLNGHISRLTYYPKRLPDIELQQLTK